MYKLKNKHTGEVITTPYLAEVEEYLNSGDYEMKNTYVDGQSYKEVDHQENTKRLFELNNFLMKHEFGIIGDSVVDTAIKLIEDAYIAKEKPVYTKKMRELGDFELGMIYLNQDSQVCELVGVNANKFIGRFTELTAAEYHLDISPIYACNPINGIESELQEMIVNNPNVAELTRLLINKYNITPKES